MIKKKGVIVSGYFNPIHKGHIDYFKKARSLGDKLFVIVNNDKQRSLKGSKAFQNENERVLIVSNLRLVDHCILSIDNDRTVRLTIENIFKNFSSDFDFYFANGGDQSNRNCPEKPICEKLGVVMVDGLGDKIQSSSWLLNK